MGGLPVEPEELTAARVRRKLSFGSPVFERQTMAVLVALARRALRARRRLRGAVNSAAPVPVQQMYSAEYGEAWNALQSAKRAALEYGER